MDLVAEIHHEDAKTAKTAKKRNLNVE